jgi:hypothetical protein
MKDNELRNVRTDYEIDEEPAPWNVILCLIYFGAIIFSPFITITLSIIGVVFFFGSPHQFIFSTPRVWSLVFFAVAVIFRIIWFKNRDVIKWDKGGPE